MEDEDEKTLKGVEDGEEVSHDDSVLTDIEQAKYPSQTQQDHQHQCSFHPRPGTIP